MSEENKNTGPQVVGKDANEILYLQLGNKGDTTQSYSKYNFNGVKAGRRLDLRMLKINYYDGWKYNDHHPTTSSYYNVILPFLSYVMKTFKFNKDDFTRVPYFADDYMFDVSYLKPKGDMRFTMSINGVVVGEHLTFDDITNTKEIHDDSGVYTNGVSNIETEYHRLYRGSHACSRVINETVDNDYSLFISGDSMLIPALPIFCCYYKEVVYMDNRDGKSHSDYYDGKMFDEIIMFYWEPQDGKKVMETNLI